MEFINVLKPLLSLFQICYDGMLGVFNFFTTPIKDLFLQYGVLYLFDLEKVLADLVTIFENTIGVTDITLVGMMLGVALPIYLIYQFVTWVLNVVT